MSEPSPDSLAIHRVQNDADWRQAHAIRTRVFVEEQEVSPDLEYDAYDWPTDRGQACTHLLAEIDGTAVGTARWRRIEKKTGMWVKLERFAVLPKWRGKGIGKALVDAALDDAKTEGYRRFMLHAQAYLEDFYASFSFETVGEPFEEAGIPHVKMALTTESPR